MIPPRKPCCCIVLMALSAIIKKVSSWPELVRTSKPSNHERLRQLGQTYGSFTAIPAHSENRHDHSESGEPVGGRYGAGIRKSRQWRKEWAHNGNDVRGISGWYGTGKPRFGQCEDEQQHASRS